MRVHRPRGARRWRLHVSPSLCLFFLPPKLTAAALRSVWPGSHRALAARNPAFADLTGSFDPPPAGSGRFKEELLEDYELVLETVKEQTPFVFNGEEGDCLFFVSD